MFCRMLSYQFFSPRPHKLNVDQIALFSPFPLYVVIAFLSPTRLLQGLTMSTT